MTLAFGASRITYHSGSGKVRFLLICFLLRIQQSIQRKKKKNSKQAITLYSGKRKEDKNKKEKKGRGVG